MPPAITNNTVTGNQDFLTTSPVFGKDRFPSSSNKPLKIHHHRLIVPNDNPCTGLGISSILSNRLPPELRPSNKLLPVSPSSK